VILLEAWDEGFEVPFGGCYTILVEVYPASRELGIIPGRDDILGDKIMGKFMGTEEDHYSTVIGKGKKSFAEIALGQQRGAISRAGREGVVGESSGFPSKEPRTIRKFN
jgi:hypothetical protein